MVCSQYNLRPLRCVWSLLTAVGILVGDSKMLASFSLPCSQVDGVPLAVYLQPHLFPSSSPFLSGAVQVIADVSPFHRDRVAALVAREVSGDSAAVSIVQCRLLRCRNRSQLRSLSSCS